MMTDAEVQADNARAHLLYVLLQLANACAAHASAMPSEVLDALNDVRAARSEYGERLMVAGGHAL